MYVNMDVSGYVHMHEWVHVYVFICVHVVCMTIYGSVSVFIQRVIALVVWCM